MGRPLSELIDRSDPAWPLVQRWLSQATNRIELLPPDRKRAEATLVALQITTRSPLGAIALECGGMLVDYGWLRILGAGNGHMAGLLEWNGLGGAVGPDPALSEAMVVGHDAVGGFFALNGGAFGADNLGKVFYLAPDSLSWENLATGYSGFVQWATIGDLASFYATSRWPGWREEMASATGDQGFSIYPFLSTVGPPVRERSRRLVPMTELWGLSWGLSRAD